MTKVPYDNLTELLLNVVKQRPAMYLGQKHISKLPNFILGYQFSDMISRQNPDFYFGEKGFLDWYVDKYCPPPTSFWQDYFLSQTGNDESKALDLFFERLAEYHDWYNSNFPGQINIDMNLK